MVSPAITASSPSRIGTIGMPAGLIAEAGWPVAARSTGWDDCAGTAGATVAVACVAELGAVAAGVLAGVCTSITSRVGEVSSRTRKQAASFKPMP